MQAIFASKLYRTSPRKDRIHAALSDPLNKELVQQLHDYLDEPYKEMRNAKPSSLHTSKDNQSKDKPSTSSVSPAGAHTSGPSSGGPAGAHTSGPSSGGPAGAHTSGPSSGGPSSSLASKFAALDSSPIPDTTSPADAPVDEPDGDVPENLDGLDNPSEPIDESTSISSSNLINNMEDVISEIKDLLNGNSETSGVSRILQKDDELWVYYNDDVNLNNAMGQVLEALNTPQYGMLQFNRLARTQNAIVFQIDNAQDTSQLQGDDINDQQTI